MVEKSITPGEILERFSLKDQELHHRATDELPILFLGG